MMFLNEGSLLSNIRRRYYDNKIYVSFAVKQNRALLKKLLISVVRCKYFNSSQSV